MRKKQSYTDALALSERIMRIEDVLMKENLTLKDADEMDAIIRHVRDLEANKIVVVPTLLRRAKRLAGVARSLRAAYARTAAP